jgi:hypothetical protein
MGGCSLSLNDDNLTSLAIPESDVNQKVHDVGVMQLEMAIV